MATEECVALLHGLWRTERSMTRLAESLGQAGYALNNAPYYSTDSMIEQLADEAVPRALADCEEAGVPRVLGPVRFDLGIIAGTQGINPILCRPLPDPQCRRRRRSLRRRVSIALPGLVKLDIPRLAGTGPTRYPKRRREAASALARSAKRQ